jgi:hypothetical protein
MKRLIRATLLALGLLTVAACTSPTGTSTVNTAQAAADASTVVNGLAADYKTFVTLYPSAIPAARQTTIAEDFAAAQTAMKQLAALPAGSTGATPLRTVETAMNDVVGVLTDALPGIPGVPPAVSAGVLAADVLLPLIEVMINQLQGVATAKPATVTLMTPDHARLILLAAAAAP